QLGLVGWQRRDRQLAMAFLLAFFATFAACLLALFMDFLSAFRRLCRLVELSSCATTNR
ncbi:MAG: hypothetical protein ACI9TF_001941, partial [Paracrocinitomix sp.]